MIRVIIELAIWAVIVLGSAAVAFAIYHGIHAAAYNPSVPHDELWRFVFGSK